MTRRPHLLPIVLLALVAALAGITCTNNLAAQSYARPDRPVSGLTAQDREPDTVSIQWHMYGFSVAPKGQASLLTLRIAGPGRTLLLDERTTGESIDWSLPGSAPDGSYRYEAFVKTTLDGPAQSSVTPGGFEVKHGQIVQP